MAICLEHESPDGTHFVVIEDDDKVAYAYLYACGEVQEIVGDVWLYNCGGTPEQPEWTDRNKLPFANPNEFADDNASGPINMPEDVEIRWDERDGTIIARISIHGLDWARLCPESKPGWCRLARKKGPLAVPLAEFEAKIGD